MFLVIKARSDDLRKKLEEECAKAVNNFISLFTKISSK